LKLVRCLNVSFNLVLGDKVQIQFATDADDSDNEDFTILQGEVVHHQLDEDDEDEYHDESPPKIWLYTCRLLQPAMTNDGTQQQGKYVTNVREVHMKRHDISHEPEFYGGKMGMGKMGMGKMGGKGGKYRPQLTIEEPVFPTGGKYFHEEFSSPVETTQLMFPISQTEQERKQLRRGDAETHAMIAAAAATAVHEYLARALGLQPEADKSTQTLSVQDVLGAASAAAAAAAQAATQAVKKKNVTFAHRNSQDSDSEGSSVYSPDFGIDPLVLVHGTQESREFQQALRDHINSRKEKIVPQTGEASPITAFLQNFGGKMRPSAPTPEAIPMPLPEEVNEKPLHSPKEDMLISAIALRGRRRSSIMPTRYSMPEPRDMEREEDDIRRRRKKNLANRRKSLDLLATIATSVANVMADDEEDEIGWDVGMEEDGEEDQLV
jgi:hypothetical protein